MERDLFRILVVSDTHGRGDGLKEAIRLARPFDHLIHCGDTEGREREIATEAEGRGNGEGSVQNSGGE